MSSVSRLCLLLLLLGSQGCKGPCFDPSLDLPPPGNDPSSLATVSREAQEAFSTRVSSCTEVPPETADVDVRGPDNGPVAASVTISKESELLVAHVSFTPERFGYYHLTVTFRPTGLRLQREVFALNERTDAPVRTLSGGCRQTLYETASGVFLCDHRAFAPDGSVQVFAGSEDYVAASGNVAWVARAFDSTLRRFDTSAFPLRQSPATPLDWGQQIVALMPLTDDEAAVVFSHDNLDGFSELALVRSDGGVDRRSVSSGSSFMALRRPSSLLVAKGVAFEEEESTRLCEYALDAGAFAATPPSCWDVPGAPAALRPDGLYTMTPVMRTLTLSAFEGPDGGVVTLDELILPRDWSIQSPRQERSEVNGGSSNPRAVDLPIHAYVTSPSNAAVMRREGNHLVLDRMPKAELGGVQAQYLWSNTDSQALIWPTR